MARKLKFGNGTWATKEGSTLAYNDENNNYKPLPFTTTRNSIATRVNKEGLIEVVGNDVPRIDYTDSADGVLLLENSATNLVTYSEDFSNAAWTKSNSSITSNSVISPDGTLNSDKLVINTSAGYLGGTFISSGNTDVTVSFFVKSDTLSSFTFAESFYFGTVTNFDLSNGTTDNGKIENYGNGWYRCSKTYTYASGQQIVAIQIKTGASGSLYIFGGQYEEGSYPTSYIKSNSGSTVTRVADTASGAGNSQVFNDSEGVLYAEISAFSEIGSSGLISLSDGTNNNRVTIELDGNTVKGRLTPSVGILNASTNIVSTSRIALKYKQNDFALWVNGFEAATSNSGNTFSNETLTKLSFDRGDGAEEFYGKTKELGYYDEILTDLELEYLTSYRSLNELVTELNLNEL